MRKLLAATVLTALLAISSPAFAADFSGTWVLDLKASDSMEPILKARGVSWMKRKAVNGLKVTQTITQSGNQVTVETSASSKTRRTTMEVDGETRTVKNDQGSAEVRHAWDGEALVSTSTMELDKGEGTVTTRRSLSEDGQTLKQTITLKTADGTTHVVDRVFRKS